MTEKPGSFIEEVRRITAEARERIVDAHRKQEVKDQSDKDVQFENGRKTAERHLPDVMTRIRETAAKGESAMPLQISRYSKRNLTPWCEGYAGRMTALLQTEGFKVREPDALFTAYTIMVRW